MNDSTLFRICRKDLYRVYYSTLPIDVETPTFHSSKNLKVPSVISDSVIRVEGHEVGDYFPSNLLCLLSVLSRRGIL